MKVLSRESLIKIDQYLLDDTDGLSLIDDFDHAIENLELDFVKTSYSDPDFEAFDLSMPGGGSDLDDKSNDALNCKIVYEAMSWLSPADATDERLWVTLCFTKGSSYLKRRYREDLSANNIRRHWTWRGDKPLYRDNGLSRLWWMGFLASKAIDWNIDVALNVLFVNSDYRQNLVDRQEIVSNEALFTAILAISKDAFDKKIEYKRVPFRNFMKDVQYLQGRSNLGALTQAKLTEILQPYYLDAYQVPRENFLGRLFKSG